MNKFLQFVSKRLTRFVMICWLMVHFQSAANAQAKFSVVASEKKISKNEYVQVQYIMENASSVTEIIPPSFKNFSIVSGPAQQSGMSNINGAVTQYVSVSFVLKPLSSGKLTIAAAKATADNKTFFSDPVKIEVSNSLASSQNNTNTLSSPFANIFSDVAPQPEVHEYDDYILRKGENIPDKIKKNLFVKVEVNKTSCYVGEPIVATYKLFTRLKSESNLTKSPSFNGFSVNDLEKPDSYSMHTEKLNGREYNVYLLRKVQLYPLQSGTLKLDPAEVENKITFIKAEYADARKGDVFYDMLHDFADANTPSQAMQEQTVTLQSQPDSIEVKPFPDEGKPADFKGAVGDFKIEAVAEKNHITTDDADNLKITISGAGNIQMINPPAVSWPGGIEGFEPKASERLDNTSVPIRGDKVFIYPFTASGASTFNIPPVTFSYFDAVSKTYKTVSSKPMEINVTKGNEKSKRINPVAVDDDIEDETFADKLYDNLWFILTGVTGLGVLIFLFVRKSTRQKLLTATKTAPVAVEEITNKESFIIPDDPLFPAKQQLEQNNPRLFYSSLGQSIKKYLSARLKFPVEDLNKKKINELLDKSNVDVSTTLMLSSLLENIELNLYAPFSSSYQMEEAYSKANEIIVMLNKQLA